MKPRKIPARLLIEGQNGENKSVKVRLEYKELPESWSGSIQTLEPVLAEDATHVVNLGDYRIGQIRIHGVDRNGKSARFTGIGVPSRAKKTAATS